MHNPNKQLCYYEDLKRLQFHYPYYVTPFKLAINPNYSKWMERYCYQWIIDNGGVLTNDPKFIELICKSDLGYFSAVTYPTASWHRLEKLIKWVTTFFVIDDYHELLCRNNFPEKDNFWQFSFDMLTEIETNRHSETRKQWPDFIKITQMMLKEIFFDYSEIQVKRSLKMIRNYMDGAVLEAKWFEEGYNDDGIPTWDEYIKVRAITVGGQMIMHWLEYSLEIEIKDHEWNHPFMQELLVKFSEEIALVNDYLSFHKELKDYDYKFCQMRHPFTILVKEGLTIQQAVDEVHQKIIGLDEDIINLTDKILADPELNTNKDTEVRLQKFLDGVKIATGATWRFTVTSGRYHKFEDGAIPPEGTYKFEYSGPFMNCKGHQYDWLKPIPSNIQPN